MFTFIFTIIYMFCVFINYNIIYMYVDMTYGKNFEDTIKNEIKNNVPDYNNIYEFKTLGINKSGFVLKQVELNNTGFKPYIWYIYVPFVNLWFCIFSIYKMQCN